MKKLIGILVLTSLIIQSSVADIKSLNYINYLPPMVNFKYNSTKIIDVTGILDVIGKRYKSIECNSLGIKYERIYLEFTYCENELKKHKYIKYLRAEEIINYMHDKFDIDKEMYVVVPYSGDLNTEDCEYTYVEVLIK